ncbi:hypothetical protein GCM10017782_30130 [Deinococcus ficus]|nr:hypothetical protein GCM10017782_30130 [Deinococcus ficus]
MTRRRLAPHRPPPLPASQAQIVKVPEGYAVIFPTKLQAQKAALKIRIIKASKRPLRKHKSPTLSRVDSWKMVESKLTAMIQRLATQGFLTGEFSTTRVQGPQFNTLLVRAGMPGLIWANFEHWTRALRDVESTGDDRTHVQAKFEPVGPISEGEHFRSELRRPRRPR